MPTETTTTTAERDPALERMVLALKDLPFGVSVKNEGYVTDGDDVSFQRDSRSATRRSGKSELIGLQSNAERMDSAAEAAVAVNAVSGVVKGPAGQKLFAESFAQGAGFSAESLRINELPGEGIGDEATVLHATFDTRVGPFEAILVFIAEGRQPARSMRPARRARSSTTTSSGWPGRWRRRWRRRSRASIVARHAQWTRVARTSPASRRRVC